MLAIVDMACERWHHDVCGFVVFFLFFFFNINKYFPTLTYESENIASLQCTVSGETDSLV